MVLKNIHIYPFLIAIIFAFSAPLLAADMPCTGAAPIIQTPELSKIADVVKKQDGAGVIAAHLDALSASAKESYEDNYYKTIFTALQDELEKPCVLDFEREAIKIYDELLNEAEVDRLLHEDITPNNSANWPEDLAEKMGLLSKRLDEQKTNLLNKISAFYNKRACIIVRQKAGPKEVIKIKSMHYAHGSKTIFVYEECKVKAE